MIRAKRIRDNGLPIPKKVRPTDAGYDLYLDLTTVPTPPAGEEYQYVKVLRGYAEYSPASFSRNLYLGPDTVAWVRTGWAIEIPFSHEGSVRGRSGLALKDGITVWHVGTIDHGYQGEILVALWNASNEPRILKHGDRIAQLVLGAYECAAYNEVVEVPEFEVGSSRGVDGFGSSGR